MGEKKAGGKSSRFKLVSKSRALSFMVAPKVMFIFVAVVVCLSS